MKKLTTFDIEILWLFSLVISALIASAVTGAVWREQAVEAGHAEYYLNGDHAVWRWKEIKTNPKTESETDE